MRFSFRSKLNTVSPITEMVNSTYLVTFCIPMVSRGYSFARFNASFNDFSVDNM